MKGQPPDLKALEYEKSNERENKDLFLFCILFNGFSDTHFLFSGSFSRRECIKRIYLYRKWWIYAHYIHSPALQTLKDMRTKNFSDQGKADRHTQRQRETPWSFLNYGKYPFKNAWNELEQQPGKLNLNYQEDILNRTPATQKQKISAYTNIEYLKTRYIQTYRKIAIHFPFVL